jgi:hypothetical protein
MLPSEPRQVALDILHIAAWCRAARRPAAAAGLVGIAAELLGEPRLVSRLRRWIGARLCSLRRHHEWGPGRRGARMVWRCYRCDETVPPGAFARQRRSTD